MTSYVGGSQELDFLVEAKNSVKCMDNFRKLSPQVARYIYAPRVDWNLSTSRLLTMEYIDGAQVNDLKTIQRLGIQPRDVAKLVSTWSSHFILFFAKERQRNMILRNIRLDSVASTTTNRLGYLNNSICSLCMFLHATIHVYLLPLLAS